jgi:hypothetical protein
MSNFPPGYTSDVPDFVDAGPGARFEAAVFAGDDASMPALSDE